MTYVIGDWEHNPTIDGYRIIGVVWNELRELSWRKTAPGEMGWYWVILPDTVKSQMAWVAPNIVGRWEVILTGHVVWMVSALVKNGALFMGPVPEPRIEKEGE